MEEGGWATAGFWLWENDAELREEDAGLREEDAGAAALQAANPSGLSGHDCASVGSKGCSGQPQQLSARSPACGDARTPPGGTHPARWAGSDPSSHPSPLLALIFIPVMSNWLGARARKKPGSAGLQLSRQRSIRDTQRRLILLRRLTAEAPNKAPSPDSCLIAFSHSFSLRKRREVAGGGIPPPLSQPLNHAAKEKATRIFSWHRGAKLRDQFERLQQSLSFAGCRSG